MARRGATPVASTAPRFAAGERGSGRHGCSKVHRILVFVPLVDISDKSGHVAYDAPKISQDWTVGCGANDARYLA
jgi:hypothetical protein